VLDARSDAGGFSVLPSVQRDPGAPGSSHAPIFELTRGDLVESLHYGSLAIVDAHGELVAGWGDPFAVTYLRSSAKPLQVLPFLEQGGRDFFDLSSQEVALMCASHSGTDEHIAVLHSIQARASVLESDLRCGVHPIGHKPTIDAMRQRGESLSPNRNNCSGKHTGMLAFAVMRGISKQGYLDPSHPIQQDILRTFAEMCSLPVEQVVVGVDGCSAPNFAVPLYHAALAYARLCDPAAGEVAPQARVQACRLVTDAMLSYPAMVGGPESFDTRLMRVLGKRLICKGGAEGYLAMGLLPGALHTTSPALGIVLKISDGDLAGHSRPAGDPLGRVRPAVALEILKQLEVLSPAHLAILAEYGPSFPLLNWADIAIGQGRPCFALERGAW
jgi:L-asparaginase II